MNGTATEIVLDENGVCNFCHQAKMALEEIEAERVNLPKIIERIKKDGEGKDYDVLCGISGGIDSSMALYHVVKLGLRVMAFSMDNGYNKSDENVMRLVEGLKVPFYRYTLDLGRFRDAHVAFLRGGVMNLEALYDHLLFAATYEMANKYGIKWIISGGNTSTESVMPASWGEDPRDLRWIKDVYYKNIGKKLKGLPTISLLKEQYYRLIKQIKFLRILDYFDYDRHKSIELLKKEFGYIPYGEKHEENYLTQWYQSFYLFTKYGIDKRIAHYSSLINSGQMDRETAMNLLQQSPVYHQLGIEKKALSYPKRSYSDYKNSEWIRKQVIKIYRYIPQKWK